MPVTNMLFTATAVTTGAELHVYILLYCICEHLLRS